METVKRYFVVLILAFTVTGTIVVQNNEPNDPWFFIQLTDPQFGMFEQNKGFEKETVLYEKAVAGINRLHSEFVVITGDFVHNQNSKEQIKEFKRITAKIKSVIPVYFVPGNHDVGQNPDKQSLKDYRKNYGKDRFVFKHNNSVFIGFNSSIIKTPLRKQEQRQYRWLTRTLKKHRNSRHIILFCHYPFFKNTVDEPESYFNIGPEYRKKYLSLFEANQVDAIFSGHQHSNMSTMYGKIRLVTTSALGKPLGDAPSGLRIIKVYKDKIQHEYYGLDELPDKVEFD